MELPHNIVHFKSCPVVSWHFSLSCNSHLWNSGWRFVVGVVLDRGVLLLQLALIALTIMVLKHLDVAPEVDDLLARRAFDLPLLTGVVLDDMLRNLFQGSCTSSFNNLFLNV